MTKVPSTKHDFMQTPVYVTIKITTQRQKYSKFTFSSKCSKWSPFAETRVRRRLQYLTALLMTRWSRRSHSPSCAHVILT